MHPRCASLRYQRLPDGEDSAQQSTKLEEEFGVKRLKSISVWTLFIIAAIWSRSPLFAQSQFVEESKATADQEARFDLNIGRVSLLSDTQGVEFGPYLTAWKKATQATWEKSFPQEFKESNLQNRRVVIRFKILPDGHIMDGSMVLEGRSGSTPLDSAAWHALTGSKFSSLPSEFVGPYLELRTVFSYNQTPKH
jgi:hypothetical protein